MIEQIFGKGFLLILATIYVAFILTLLPMASGLNYFRPDWVLLVTLFWTQVLPNRFGLAFAFIFGLCLDVLLAQTLGTYALAMTCLVYLQLMFNRRLRVSSVPQQMLRLFLFSLAYILIARVLQNFFGDPVPMKLGHWLPAISNALLWPWLFILLDNIRRRVGIYEQGA